MEKLVNFWKSLKKIEVNLWHFFRLKKTISCDDLTNYVKLCIYMRNQVLKPKWGKFPSYFQ